MCSWKVKILAAVLTAAPALGLSAQEPPSVQPGARVRVTAPSLSPRDLIGVILEVDASTFLLEAEGYSGPVRVPLDSMTGLQVSRGQLSRAGLGAWLGFWLGAGVAASIGHVHLGGDIPTSAENMLLGLGGLIVGLGIGTAIKVDDWDPVPLEGIAVRLGDAGHFGRLAVGLSIPF